MEKGWAFFALLAFFAVSAVAFAVAFQPGTWNLKPGTSFASPGLLRHPGTGNDGGQGGDGHVGPERGEGSTAVGLDGLADRQGRGGRPVVDL